jgi:hypothetical protein
MIGLYYCLIAQKRPRETGLMWFEGSLLQVGISIQVCNLRVSLILRAEQARLAL